MDYGFVCTKMVHLNPLTYRSAVVARLCQWDLPLGACHSNKGKEL